MKQQRAAVEDPVQQAELCLQHLLRFKPFLQAKRVFCYASYGTELPTAAIAKATVELGKQVAYPKVTGEGTMEFFVGAKLAAGYRGIPEPLGGVPVVPGERDIMLLPALAFSANGYRLGYGKGFYDRYMAALTEHPYYCGLGYNCQLLPALPQEPHDRQLNALILPAKILIF